MSVTGSIRANAQRDPAELEREIDETRADISRVIDALGERLSPGQLLDQALGMVKAHGGEFAGNLGRTAKYNPVPLLLTGVGLAWLMARGDTPPPPDWDAGVDSDSPGLGERAAATAGSLQDSARSTREGMRRSADRARAKMQRAGGAVRTGTERARVGFDTLLEEQPLVLGALGIAIGGLLGVSMPRTRFEDETIGEYSDRAKATAAGTVADRAEELKEQGRTHRQGEPESPAQDSPGFPH
jgi:ElaB/YqjD/DUF883 family membrane-anchored ribosome-binding protein